MTQAKEDFVLVFPKGMCGEKTINVHVSPFTLKDLVKQILISQQSVFGNLCIVQAGLEYDFQYGNSLMMACTTGKRGQVKFFTEDDDVQQVIETEEVTQ